MSIIGSILKDQRSGLDGGNPQTPSYWVKQLFGGGANGGRIDEQSALTISAVWNAINIIAGAVGYLPFITYRRKGKGREPAYNHPVYKLLHDRANPYMDALTMQETLQGHVLTWGNGYAEIERNNSSTPIALWPLLPNKVEPEVYDDGNKVRYRYINGGKTSYIAYENMLHIKGLGFEGLKGYSVIRIGRESLGQAKALERYGSAFFKNNATPPAVLEHPGTLTDTAEKHLRESWDAQHKGVDNAGRMAILEEGMKVHQIGIPPEDAQYLSSRKFSVVEVARWFDIALHMLKDLEKATFSNIEHLGIEFVVWTLTRWLKRWETECHYKLFGEKGQREFYPEFQTNALLRGDAKSRFEAYRIGIYAGWINRNEARAWENMNEADGLSDFLQPQNYKVVGEDTNDEPPAEPTDEPPAEPTEEPPAEPASESTETNDRFRNLFESTWRRIITKEVNALSRILKKGGDLEPKIREFYENHKIHVRDVLDPVLRVFGANPKAIDDEANRYIEDSQSDLLGAMRYWDGAELLKNWKENKAAQMAEEIVARGKI